jgi:cytochrome c peroxidase
MRLPRASLLALFVACGDPTTDPADQPLTTGILPAGLPDLPAETTLTESTRELRAQLGRKLFFDPVLSRTGKISCGSCHRPAHGFADSEAVSAGVDERRGTRNAPALINLAWTGTLFWDGRVATLEEQTGLPLENPDEMDLPPPEAVKRLSADAGYKRAFFQAYGEAPSTEGLRVALATFIRTLVSGESPYDRFLRGDPAALDAAAQRGMKLFFTDKGGCFHCHPAGALTNHGFFNNGTYDGGPDVGRLAVTKRSGDLGKFKVPGLRNVAATSPYMHDGSIATLEEVVEQYTRGGRGHPSTDAVIVPLALQPSEKADLVAFLRALTDESFLSDPRYR